jgi:lambda family phage portal protein
MNKKELSIIDRVIRAVSPSWHLSREFSKLKLERAYDAAGLYPTSDWLSAQRTSANSETRLGLLVTRDRARDLTRNSPYANKALNVIVSNTVGSGIVPRIQGRNKSQTKALTAKWKQWAESTLLDKESVRNFYGMQAAVLRCIAESGEVLVKKVVEQGTMKLQLLEPDYINPNSNNNIDNIQGVWIDPKTGNITGYQLYTNHPGDYRSYNLDSYKISRDDIIHAFRRERLGQMRGMPWAYSVVTTLKDYADFQNATVIRQKVAACFTAFIGERESDQIADVATLQAQRALENTLEPATMRYLAPGQTIQFASPPAVDQYDEFASQTLRSIAAGFGITYESLTGDYSKVNFSSGRMGHLEMQRNLDDWRWNLIIPQFCEPVFQYFLKWCAVQGIDVTDVAVDWTCPAREMIDPTAEVASLQAQVRAGFKTLPEAIRERGLDPDALIEEAAEFNQKLDDLKLVFDSDPRQMTVQGMSQSIPPQPPEAAIAAEQAKQKATLKATADAAKAHADAAAKQPAEATKPEDNKK